MAKISDPAAAKRLALAIVTDLVLYNEDELKANRAIEVEIAEGRALYESRTEAHLHSQFDEALPQLHEAGRRMREGGPAAEVEMQTRGRQRIVFAVAGFALLALWLLSFVE